MLQLLGFAVPITERHLAVFAGNNVFFLDDAFIEIATQIHQRFIAAADGLDVDDPFLGKAIRQRQTRLGDGFEQFGSKYLGQCPVIEQITGAFLVAAVFAVLGTLQAFVCVDSACRHHQMHMRMVIEAT